jgi:hypothetical protein
MVEGKAMVQFRHATSSTTDSRFHQTRQKAQPFSRHRCAARFNRGKRPRGFISPGQKKIGLAGQARTAAKAMAALPVHITSAGTSRLKVLAK